MSFLDDMNESSGNNEVINKPLYKILEKGGDEILLELLALHQP